MMKIQTKIRIILGSILVFVLVWLIWQAVVPFGKIVYIHDFEKDNYFIKKLTPDTRVKEPQGGVQKIIGNPVYFSLYTPRAFNSAKLSLKYRRCEDAPQCAPENLPIVEAGVLVDKTVWRYNLKPVENHIIEQLSMAWEVERAGATILLQRQKKYNSVNEFKDNLPPINEIAVYNYDLDFDYIVPGYEPRSEAVEFIYPLRGAYQFYTYIKDEDLDFTFFITDINSNKDADQIDLNLYFNDELIDSRHLADDGIIEDDGQTSAEQTINFKAGNLPEGVYKVELKANDDIITGKIISKQQKLAFINKIWLYENRGNNVGIEIFTDANFLNAQTVNPNSLQAIKLVDSDFLVDQTYKQFTAGLKGSSTKFILERGDIIISGDGVFSFWESGLINPGIKKVDAALDINGEGINYVIAGYTAPEAENNWQQAEVGINLKNAYREKNKYSFIISLPGLRADDETNDWVELDEVRVKLEGKSLWQKIVEVFNF